MLDIKIYLAGSYLTREGNLVLRRQANEETENRFGVLVKKRCGHLGRYFFILDGDIGILQIHKHYRDEINIPLACESINLLRNYALQNPNKKIGIPNIKDKKLNIALTVLPATVERYKYDIETFYSSI